MAKRYIFPFSEIPSGSRIIIYGIGEIGKQYISQINSTDVLMACMSGQSGYNVEIIFAVAEWGFYYQYQKHEVQTYAPEIIGRTNPNEYDYIVIAEEDLDKIEEIKAKLNGYKVPDDKVICAVYKYDEVRDLQSPEVRRHFNPSFSAWGEDIIAKDLLFMMGIKKPSYLDIGCNKPYGGNNTALFYLTGSHGTNIDANYKCMELMCSERPDDQNICCGVMCEEGEKDFLIVAEYSPLNSFSEDFIDDCFEASIGSEKTGVNRRKVKCYTLERIIQDYCEGIFPDFFDLDIEGMDDKVMLGYDFAKNGPKVICVESHSSEVLDYMKSQGYDRHIATPNNSIYVRREFMEDGSYNQRVDECFDSILDEIKYKLSGNDGKQLKLVIYGVGKVARRVFEDLCCGDDIIPVEGFLVRSMEHNPAYWMGKEVKEIGGYDPAESLILVALAHHNQKGVEEELRHSGYENIIFIDQNSSHMP